MWMTLRTLVSEISQTGKSEYFLRAFYCICLFSQGEGLDHSSFVEVKGQLVKVSFFLSPCGWDSSPQA